MIDFDFWLYILLIFTRMTAFMGVAPYFSIRNVPPLARGALAFVLAILIYPVIPLPKIENFYLLSFVLFLAGEALAGLILGYTAAIIFSAIKMAGQLIDIQIGLAMASIFDPQSGSQNTLLSQFLYTIAVLTFMIIDGHHHLLQSLVKSYEFLPLAAFKFAEEQLVKQIVNTFTGVFIIALKIAAPILAVLIIVDLSLGLVARTVPQLNVFILGFPLKIGLGIIALAVVTPLLASVFINVYNLIEKDLLVIMRLM